MDAFKISTAAACIAEMITLPICAVKTIYQTDLKYKSIRNVASDIYKKQGIRGFYNSSGWAILSQSVSTGTKYSGYSALQKHRNTRQNDLQGNMINGMIGGIISTVFVHPIDVLKVHKQNNYNFLNELKLHGPKLFYRGASKSLTKNMLLTSINFPIHDFCKHYTQNTFVAAALASFTTSLIVHPIDYLKVRHISGQDLYPSSSVRYYYRGFHINLMRIMPHFIITMACIDYFKSLSK